MKDAKNDKGRPTTAEFLAELIRREYPGCTIAPDRISCHVYIDVYSSTLEYVDKRPLDLPEAIRKRPFQQLHLRVENELVTLKELGTEDGHLPESNIGSLPDPDLLQKLLQAIVAYCDYMVARYRNVGFVVTYDLITPPQSFDSLPPEAKKLHPEPTTEVSNG